MDANTTALVFGAGLQLFCWLIPPDRLPRLGRAGLSVISAGGIIYALAGYSLTGGNPMGLASSRFLFVGVWLVVGAAVGALVGDIAWRQHEPQYHGVLCADGVVFDPKSDAVVKLQIGEGAILEWQRSSIDFFDLARERWGDSNRLPIERINGELKVSTMIHNSLNGTVVASLVRDEWEAAKRPEAWDRNYNRDALEVMDATGDIVLQIRARPDRVQLQGKWHLGVRDWPAGMGRGPRGPGVMVLLHPGPGGNRSLIKPFTSPEDARGYVIEPIFEYPSSTKLGQLRPSARRERNSC
jgi:hypothetical protein